MVAKGYTQQEGVDFIGICSPVAKLVTVKSPNSLGCTFQLALGSTDVNTAFLYGDLFEETYMDLPLGYGNIEISHPSRKLVCKLRKSIYGLKQASQQWYSKFSQSSIRFGLALVNQNQTIPFSQKDQAPLLLPCWFMWMI